MSAHRATVVWERRGATLLDQRYSRGHRWRFDGGIEIPASASPHIVPLPHSVEAAVDPEEAFVASLASCHMLFFLSLAARRGLLVERYEDDAIGQLAPDSGGRLVMIRVTLRPFVQFGGERHPTTEEVAVLHHEAHEECFLARSVRTEVACEPRAISIADASPIQKPDH